MSDKTTIAANPDYWADKPTRTRFGPSPTGPLHIGGLRTALFSWLLARANDGQFILRIEDTDQTRYVEGALDLIMDGMRWLGLEWDEGPDKGGTHAPYFQSQRLELYQQWAQWLIDNDKAYRAYDTSEELAAVNEERKKQKLPPGYNRAHRDLTPEQEQALIDEGRTPVVRLKVPLDGTVVGRDVIRGEVSFENSTLQDIVLLKSDGFPTYHLAHVVDDHFMEISHVTRANEWLPSLPVHLHLWHAFGWEVPMYAHLPVLLNPNGQGKLSKRHAGFVQNGKQILVLAKEFADAGYLPEAMLNFLTNIGWTYGDEVEVFSTDEALKRFKIEDVQASNSAFPLEKLDWLNGVYMREHITSEELATRLRPLLEDAGFMVDNDMLLKVAPLVQTRMKTLTEITELAGFFFREEFVPPSADDLIQKKMDADGTRDLLDKLLPITEAVEPFTTEQLHAVMDNVPDEMGLKKGQVFGTLRVAVTGQKISTPTFETMEIVGKKETLRRMTIARDIAAKVPSA